MVISDSYREDAFTAMKTLMIPKPETPQLKGIQAGIIVEEAMWRSEFLTISHCILNTDSIKTHSSGVTF